MRAHGEISPTGSQAVEPVTFLEQGAVMSFDDLYVFPAARAAELGLPAIELRFRTVDGLIVGELAEDAGSALLRGVERGRGARVVGTIDIELFAASFVIDRAGVLHDAVQAAADAVLAGPARWRLLGEGEVELAGGTSGHRIDALIQFDRGGRFRPDCPYASWLALAADDAVVRGGVLVTVRSAGPDWSAASALLESLAIVGPPGAGSGAGGSGTPGAGRLGLPLVRGR
jgi:hypothetical protein